MAYIGRGLDKISNIEHLDTITFDGSSSYSLTKSSVAFTPNSAQSLIVSIDGVVQSNNFTVSGSTIDFGVAVPSTSTCDFIKHFGTGVAFTPADGTVTSSTIANSMITGQTEDTTPADDDLILVYDTSASALKKVQKSNFAGGGITEADQWRLTANTTSTGVITSNLERNDTASFGYLGTGMTESSGVFTFPSTGYWYVVANFNFYTDTGDERGWSGHIRVTTDNFSTDTLGAISQAGSYNTGGATGHNMSSANFILDVTDTSNVKCKFQWGKVSNGTLIGNTSYSTTHFTFIRLGDT